jgi:hypothetical protein
MTPIHSPGITEPGTPRALSPVAGGGAGAGGRLVTHSAPRFGGVSFVTPGEPEPWNGNGRARWRFDRGAEPRPVYRRPFFIPGGHGNATGLPYFPPESPRQCRLSNETH